MKFTEVNVTVKKEGSDVTMTYKEIRQCLALALLKIDAKSNHKGENNGHLEKLNGATIEIRRTGSFGMEDSISSEAECEPRKINFLDRADSGGCRWKGSKKNNCSCLETTLEDVDPDNNDGFTQKATYGCNWRGWKADRDMRVKAIVKNLMEVLPDL